MFYNPYEDDSEFAEQYKSLQLNDDGSYMYRLNDPGFNSGMLPDYREAQRTFDYRSPASDNSSAVIPIALPERGAIDDDVEPAKSHFLRSKKKEYETRPFDKLDLSRAGDTMTALFKKSYGYTPSTGELMQYSNLYAAERLSSLQMQVSNLSSSLKPGFIFGDSYEPQELDQSGGLLKQYFGSGSQALDGDSLDGRETPDLNIPSRYDIDLNKAPGVTNLFSSYDPAELQRAGYKRNAAFFAAPEDRDGRTIQGLSDIHEFERQQAQARLAHDLDTSISKNSVDEFQTSIGLRKYAQEMYKQGNMQEVHAAHRRIIALGEF